MKVEDKIKEAKVLFSDLGLIFNKKLSEYEIERYIYYFKNFEFNELEESIKDIIYNWNFFPNVNEIIRNMPKNKNNKIKRK